MTHRAFNWLFVICWTAYGAFISWVMYELWIWMLKVGLL
jgi:hypothetical protein